MAATIVTPEIVRTVFLRRTFKSLLFSSGFRQCMSSEFDGIVLKPYFSAILVLATLTSFREGFGMLIRYSMISLHMVLSIS